MFRGYEESVMRLNQDQMRFYEENGYLLLPNCFSKADVEIMKAELPGIFAEDSERRVVEKERGIVRSVYGSHVFNDVFNRLSRHPRIVEPAMAILNSKVYVYQFKINAKTAFGGDVWQWHQDYIFWLKEDGLPTERVTSAVVFLDDVTQFNAPLFLIPGSHKEGVIDVAARDRLVAANKDEGQPYHDSPVWISNLTADLKYSLDQEVIASLVRRYGIVSAEGPSGSVLFFHSNLIHGSSNNISPFDRVLVLVSYNSVENIPRPVKSPRPDFLVSRDYEPIEPLINETLAV
jgi:ectoine hydroxylase-related dioxygenase (phytanoyl-CoA dioxygenase family)